MYRRARAARARVLMLVWRGPPRRAAPGGELSTHRHIPALEGLRGVAAVIVVVRHAFNALDMSLATRAAFFASPAAVLLNAQGAVLLFFVLSGYVLASSLTRSRRPTDVLQFFVKRIFRIHPPYVFAALVAWAASACYGPAAQPGRPGLSPWLQFFASLRVPLPRLLPELGFPGAAGGLLPVGWSLRVEMIYSLALPLMFVFARRLGAGTLVACALLLVAVEPAHALRWYGVGFALGIAAFLWRERLARLTVRLPAPAAALWVAAALALFSAPLWLGWSEERVGLLIAGHDLRGALVMNSGSFALVVAAVHLPGFARALSHRPALFLGRVSYSLYLLHFTLLVLLAPVVRGYGGWTDYPKLLSLVLGASLVLSALAYRLVERPSITLGNRVCAKLARLLHTGDLRSERADHADSARDWSARAPR